MAADDLGAPQEPLEHETGRLGSVRSIHGLDGRRRRRHRRPGSAVCIGRKGTGGAQGALTIEES